MQLHGFDLFLTRIQTDIYHQDPETTWLGKEDMLLLNRLGNKDLQKKFVLEQAFRRAVLAGVTGLRPESLIFERNSAGKPFLINYPGMYFSLSKSAGRVVMAVGRQPVGVDIEVLTGRLPDRNMVAYLNRNRDASLDPLPEDIDEFSFKRWWAQNEAVQKLRGVTMDDFGWVVPVGVKERSRFLREQQVDLAEIPVEGYAGWMAFERHR